MTSNLHPIFVHFPIALLFIYSIIKILPFKKWFPRIDWRDIEFVFLLLGFLGALVSLSTGETAQHLTRPNRALVSAHSNFAGIATFLYGALLAGEIFYIFNQKILSNHVLVLGIKKITLPLEKILCNNIFSALLALVALVCMTVTGLLGGALVYGTSADPLASFVLRILKITL